MLYVYVYAYAYATMVTLNGLFNVHWQEEQTNSYATHGLEISPICLWLNQSLIILFLLPLQP